ncbi:hypothetical protein THTE_2340 [Thermogutta terrifontis]|uniref:Uncharacterized protein n=1 Tax=Thermogutta terrifontis TaxID=1331910 RepID=A0A286RG75_9BACT|nr:hypothetical protein [Thermogutta terrifontis]ASV74942.1 hypothetical protein THTE_2340 [Thermogutta terrifontis]
MTSPLQRLFWICSALWSVICVGLDADWQRHRSCLAETGPNASPSPIPFDAAPFAASILDEPGKTYGVVWAEWRRIRAVEAEFDPGSCVSPQSLQVQYWHRVWDGLSDPILSEADVARTGWKPMDDWTNGSWKLADTRVTQEGNRIRWTFAPTHKKEFSNLKQSGVTYRKTLKIRIVAEDHLPRVTAFRVFTDSVYRPLTVRIYWGVPGVPQFAYQGENAGRLEIFNGILKSLRHVEGSPIVISQNGQFVLPADSTGALDAEILTTMSTVPGSEDQDPTIVTVRTLHNPFSFAVADLIKGERILVDDLGVLVTKAEDPIDLSQYRHLLREFPGRCVYDRIFDQPEQTLARAWNDMPLKRPLYFVHGLPGNRNLMMQTPNGDIAVSNVSRWFNLPRSPKDTDRKNWNGAMLQLGFGFPNDDRRGGRELRDGYLPLLRTWWAEGPLFYQQETVLDALDGDLNDVQMDDPTLLLMRVRIVNTSADESATARLVLTSRADQTEKLQADGPRVYAVAGENRFLRCLFDSRGRGTLSAQENALVWTCSLKPGEAHEVYLFVPSITLSSDQEIASVLSRQFDRDSSRILDFWSKLAAETTEVETPEPWLNHFYRAVLYHNEINCTRDIAAPRRYARVGSLRYGVFPNESVMMIMDLDRRGRHETARQCLQTFLDFQGTVPLPGNFQSTEGLFYGAGGYESGGYNKHHGYVMFGMADHWWITRDRQWMAQAAPKLVKACDWVIRERRATMQLNPDGTRPIEYGFLPSGGLEDVQDYWYWLATNVNTAWGFTALSEALADYGHPEAARLLREAAAYREDILRGLTEARIRAPVVRLRDGTYVPKYPSHLHERGRSLGWIRETLEGSLFLLIHRLLPPKSPEGTWILKDYEDNLYISNAYGYSIPVFERFWFSRGGFSMQANLLDGPLPYLYRDEIKHFLRAYFNGFASAFYPEVMMCNEHSNPELGYPAGDHFKSSDESNVTFWLRLMFIQEDGDDLYLGRAIPRYWVRDGQRVRVERAPTYFRPMSLIITSHARDGRVEIDLLPPERNPPQTIYLRIRHPDAKPLKRVTVNGQSHDKFDKDREWIILPGNLNGTQKIVAYY